MGSQHLRRRWTRPAAIAVAFPLVVAASGGIQQLLDNHVADSWSWLVWLLPIAVYGALARRLWTLGMPLVWSAGYLGVQWLVDHWTGGCSVCDEDFGWGTYPFFFLVVAVAPMTVSLFLGLLAGALARAAGRGRGRAA